MIACERTEPCSAAQLRHWFAAQLAPGDPALTIVARWQIDGPLDHAALVAAWRRLIDRHEALRTSFRIVDGEPRQIRSASVPVTIPAHDLRAQSPIERERDARRIVDAAAAASFDLTCAPLIAATRIILGDDRSELIVTAHRAICDERSLAIAGRELLTLLAHGQTDAAPPPPASPQTDADVREPAASLREMLRDAQPFTFLADHPRSRRDSSAAATVRTTIAPAVSDALTRLERDRGWSARATLCAAWFALLSRHSAHADILIGMEDAGRASPATAGRVGRFAHSVPIRCDLASTLPFETLVARVADRLADLYGRRPLEAAELTTMMAPASEPGRDPFFAVHLTVDPEPALRLRAGALALAARPQSSAGTTYDLDARIVRTADGWEAVLDYRRALYEESTVAGLLDRFGRLLAAVVADPATPIGAIGILSDADRQLLSRIADPVRTPLPAATTYADLVARQIARTPGALAVTCDGQTLTFAQLGTAAQRLAAELTARGCTRGQHIGILLERSTDLVVAILAIAGAGCAYVPLDPAYPRERLAFIAADAGLAALVTSTTLAASIALPATQHILMDTLPPIADCEPATFTPAATPDDAAYTIYTSGSTGKPKGVRIGHRALLNFLIAMRTRPGLTAHDTLVAVTTISFDIAGLELLLPLVAGAKLVIASAAELVDGHALLRRLHASNATIVQATPVTWQLLIAAGWSGDPRLTVLCGGEALARPLADDLVERAAAVWNMYGPTETTIWSSVARVGREAGPVLIGPPIANTQFYVLDDAGQLTPPGVPGELSIGGEGVALGYHERPELTRDAFVPDTFAAEPGKRLFRTRDLVRVRPNGALEFLGRADGQIKLRGFRIELGEIAATLLGISGVADAVAIAVDAGGSPAIRAFVALATPEREDPNAAAIRLRERLAEFLPAYMLPAAIVVLDRLPRTPNGKIDRRALAQTVDLGTPDAGEAPRTATESTIATLTAQLLGRERVGRSDDLFTLGLHSLLIVRLIAQIERELNVELAIRTVFDYPTVAGIAHHVGAASASPGNPAKATASACESYNERGTRSPFFYFHNDDITDGHYCRRLAAQLGPDQPLVAIAPYGSAGLPILTTIEAMARDALARIIERQPRGPYRLGGFCSGGIVAFELARLLRARGESVASLVVINAPAPLRLRLPGGDRIVRRIGLDRGIHSLVREKICLNMTRFLTCVDAGPAAVLRFLGARASTAVRLRERGQRFVEAHPQTVVQIQGTRQTEAGMARIVADLTYHPRPDADRVTLIWSTGDETPMGDPLRGDPTMGWGAVARQVEIIPLAGGHDSPIAEHVDALGRILATLLHEPQPIPITLPASQERQPI